MDLIRKIQTHLEVYTNAGLEVPPFRMTYEENMQFNKHFIKHFKLPSEREEALLADFMGVKIEIVVILKGISND